MCVGMGVRCLPAGPQHRGKAQHLLTVSLGGCSAPPWPPLRPSQGFAPLGHVDGNTAFLCAPPPPALGAGWGVGRGPTCTASSLVGGAQLPLDPAGRESDGGGAGPKGPASGWRRVEAELPTGPHRLPGQGDRVSASTVGDRKSAPAWSANTTSGDGSVVTCSCQSEAGSRVEN